MNKRVLISYLFIFLMMFSLGIGVAGAKDTFNYAIPGEPTSLDPTKVGDQYSRTAVFQIYDSLIEQKPDRTLVPGLAKSWEYSEDGTEITFNLRDDVKFHNGDLLTAEDVAFSLNMAIASPFASRVTTAMESAEVVDEHTVVLKLQHAFGPVEECLATSQMGIINKKAYEADPDGFGRNPVGTGPYKFVDWVRGSELKLLAYEDYYRGPAAITNLTFKIITDPTTQIIALEKGEVDFVVAVPVEEIESVERHRNLTFYPAESTAVVYIAFDNNDEIFSNPKVRQAVAHAIDKEAMILGVQDGRGTPLETPMSKATFGWPEEFVNREWNVEKGKALMVEAGYPNGFRTTIVASEVADYRKRSEILQDQLKSIGITADIEILEWGAFLDQILTQRQFPITTISMTTPYLDADHIYELYHSTMITQGRNFISVQNDELDALLETGRFSIDPDERLDAYTKIAELWKEEAFTVPLYTSLVGVAAHKDLVGIVEDGPYLGEYGVYYFSWKK